MNDSQNNNAYDRAKKQVEAEKGFYSHLTAYVIINVALLLINIDFRDSFGDWFALNLLSTPVLWGIGLLIHGLCVFKVKLHLFKNWEERKIKELMDKDDL